RRCHDVRCGSAPSVSQFARAAVCACGPAPEAAATPIAPTTDRRSRCMRIPLGRIFTQSANRDSAGHGLLPLLRAYPRPRWDSDLGETCQRLVETIRIQLAVLVAVS